MIEKRTFESASSSAVYEALLDTDTGASSCNCKGWTFKRPGKPRGCKHTKALAIEWTSGMAPEAVAAIDPAKKARVEAKLEEFAIRSKGKRMIVWDDEEMDEPEPGPAVKPMLARAMTKEQSIADFDDGSWVLEEKHDGHRMLVVREGDTAVLWSRPGATHPATQRTAGKGVHDGLLALPVGIYDGELTVPGGTSSDVARIDRMGEQVMVLFDVVESLGIDVTKRPYTQRRALLELVAQHAPDDGKVVVSESYHVTQQTVDDIWARGGEGAILKKADSPYEPGRRAETWVKVKKLSHVVLTIVGFKEGKRGPQSVAILEDGDGLRTTSSFQTNALVDKVAADPDAWIGKRWVCSYLGKTTKGLWRHLIMDHEASESEAA